MKKYMFTAISIALVLTMNFPIFAQGSKELKSNEVAGFFITASDFSSGKLSQPTDNKHKGDKIRLSQFFISPNISVIEQGIENKYPKDSIFAIKDHNPCNL